MEQREKFERRGHERRDQEEIKSILVFPLPTTAFIFHNNPYPIHLSITYQG